ncbi:MAG: hypothetical protein OXB88_05285 [Bacteriovoracales bacterium]|nr:hypothetical protein [Bacteriovoracales bacterium]
MNEWENKQETKVHIVPDPTVSRAKFKPDPTRPGSYLAHPISIRALKKDIFVMGEHLSETEEVHTCPSCHVVEDRQFWHFCPHCESSWPKQTTHNKASV